jgi:imidazolonepropionase-like amidohydrolase
MIDCTGGPVIEDPVIVIEGGRIKSAGKASETAVPPGAEIIDAAGYTLLPGLMDLHVHLCLFNNRTFSNYRVAQFEVTPHLQQLYALFHGQLSFEMGFTTMRDLGLLSYDGLLTPQMCAVRDAINGGIFAGPRLIVGAFTTITNAHLELVFPRNAPRKPLSTADGPWELRKLARVNLRHGCDVIKTSASGGGGTDKEAPDIRNMTQEEVDAIVDEAHAFHKQCAVHCFTPDSHRMSVKAGADTIEHMVFHDEDSVEKIVESGIYVVPTLLHRTDHAIEIRKDTGAPKNVLNKMKEIQPYCFDTFQKMHKAGVKIAMGTDMGYEPGFGSNAMELELYIKFGMTPMEALLTATKHAAAAIKMSDDLGTIEAGKIADVIAVKGDPLADIRVLQERKNIGLVMKDGTIFVDRRPGKSKEVIDVEPDSWKFIDSE